MDARSAVRKSPRSMSMVSSSARAGGVVDLIGKGKRVGTVPMPPWVKAAIDAWTAAAVRLFRSVNKGGNVGGFGLTEKVIWQVLLSYAKAAGLGRIAPHDLRRTCARLCHEILRCG